MIQVLPIWDITQSMFQQTRHFVESQGLESEGLTVTKCHEVVMAIMASILSDQLEWIPLERQRHDVVNLSRIVKVASNMNLYATFAGFQDAEKNDDAFRLDFAEKILHPEVELVRATARLFDWYVAVKPERSTITRNPAVKRALELTDEYDSYIIADIWNTLGRIIDPIIPVPTWDVWLMRGIGRDIYLEKGLDYRVLDWQRRMKNGGEW